MSLRRASAMFKDIAKNLTPNAPDWQANTAMENLADGLFLEFADLNQRLDRLEARLLSLENPKHPDPAKS